MDPDSDYANTKKERDQATQWEESRDVDLGEAENKRAEMTEFRERGRVVREEGGHQVPNRRAPELDRSEEEEAPCEEEENTRTEDPRRQVIDSKVVWTEKGGPDTSGGEAARPGRKRTFGVGEDSEQREMIQKESETETRAQGEEPKKKRTVARRGRQITKGRRRGGRRPGDQRLKTGRLGQVRTREKEEV